MLARFTHKLNNLILGYFYIAGDGSRGQRNLNSRESLLVSGCCDSCTRRWRSLSSRRSAAIAVSPGDRLRFFGISPEDIRFMFIATWQLPHLYRIYVL
ncbi:hypothetical protein VB713_01625 [Anabaena cylindrica UHCC 0172]|nr:hypothetical protein [Anabaena cylindrica UHCC 0172]